MSQQQQQQPPASSGAFIGGIVAGLFAGGTLLTLIVFLLGLAIASAITKSGGLIAIGFGYAIAVAVCALGFFLVRKNVGFLSGFVIGAGAGLLGGITLCSGITSGLNNMH